MPRKKHTPEEIVAKLRQVDVLSKRFLSPYFNYSICRRAAEFHSPISALATVVRWSKVSFRELA